MLFLDLLDHVFQTVIPEDILLLNPSHTKWTHMLPVHLLRDALLAECMATFGDGWLHQFAHTDGAVESLHDGAHVNFDFEHF